MTLYILILYKKTFITIHAGVSLLNSLQYYMVFHTFFDIIYEVIDNNHEASKHQSNIYFTCYEKLRFIQSMPRVFSLWEIDNENIVFATFWEGRKTARTWHNGRFVCIHCAPGTVRHRIQCLLSLCTIGGVNMQLQGDIYIRMLRMSNTEQKCHWYKQIKTHMQVLEKGSLDFIHSYRV